MEDVFASPEHPSLFPMIIPCPKISKDDNHLFYKNECRLFTILLLILNREVFQSMMSMGFFIWLEREGYSSKNLVEMIINSLSPEVFNQLVDEVVVCLQFLQKTPNNVSTSTETSISLLKSLLDRKDINLQDFYRNKDQIFSEVFVIAKDIYVKTFDDIIEQQVYMNRNRWPVVMRSPGHVNVHPIPLYNISPYVRVYQNPVGAAGSTSRIDAHVMQNYAMMHHQQMVRLGGSANDHGVVPFYATGCVPYVVREPEEEVPPEERTISVTFSKGYPIFENEVKDYFTRYIKNQNKIK